MLSFVRRRMTFANVGMTVALVFAMSGGAFAAGKFLITSTKQISPKVLKSLQGKAGPAGSQGLAGSAGAPGPKGDAGAAGANGVNGSNGVSAEATSFTGNKTIGSVTCTEGGLLVKSASGETLVCNGKKGSQGAPGAPGVIHPEEKLPSGASETGAWGVSGPVVTIDEYEVVLGSISFPIPLGKAPKPHVYLVGEGPSAGCSGTAAAPVAEAGNLCIFVAKEENLGAVVPVEPAAKTLPAGSEKAGSTGAVLGASPLGVGTEVSAYGTWAVTAE